MNGERPGDETGSKSCRKRQDEARLVQRAKQGDSRAAGELYQRHADAIYRYVWARVQDDVIAEDLTGQVFLKALEGLSTYESTDKPFLSWLYRIAYARVVDHWRQQDRCEEIPLDDALPARDPRPYELLAAEADWGRAIDLLAHLTDDQQDVIILRFVGEMSLSDVAETLGKTVGATKAVQHRALASLARLLATEEKP
ncbi:MAG TPA: sigma-70 family RNA polymerase sigma factor [Anaerolineae bacterium]|nr:sigma-70 family RNA polymerase sigma factor [Anaerolineae bacterium]